MKKRSIVLGMGSLLALSACNFTGGRGLPEDSQPGPQQPGADQPIPEGETSALQGTWYGGDMHVHTDHSSDGSGPRQGLDQRGPANVSVADQIGEGTGQGLDWMPLTDHRTYSQHYDPLWESSELLLVPGEEANGSPHANPLGAVDSIVQGSVPEGRPDWSRLQTSIWDAHAQGATWSHNHPDDGHMNDDDTLNERANAVGADTVEVWNKGSGIERELFYAETQWNRGFRFAGVGASDNHFRELWKVAGPGTPVTHVFAPELTERGVIRALRAGHVSVNVRDVATPFVVLTADFDGADGFEVMSGDEVVVAEGTAGVLRVNVTNGLGATLLIHSSPGGDAGVVASMDITSLDAQFDFPVVTNGQDQWFYAEVRGPGELDSVDTSAQDDPTVLIQLDTGTDERRALAAPVFIGPRLASAQGAEPIPADIGTDDGATAIFARRGVFYGFPDVAVAGAAVHRVAERHSTTGTEIFYSGPAVAAMSLAPGSTAARFPKVAAQGADVWVAWQDERAGQIPRRPAIYLRHSADNGVTWGEEAVVRSLAGRAEKPDLALLPDGQPVLVWQEIAADRAFDVMVQVIGVDAEPINLSAGGKTIQPYDGIDTRSAIYPASVWPKVAVETNGRIAVVFQDNRLDPDPLWTSQPLTGEDNSTEADNYDIGVVTRAPGGDWTPVRLLGSDTRLDAHPDVAFAANGQLVVVWDSKEMRASGANLSIRWSASFDGGSNWTAVDEAPSITESIEHMSQYPRLGVNRAGEVEVVWYDNRAADWRWRVMHSRFDGAAWQRTQMFMSPGVNTWPAVDQGVVVFAGTRLAQRPQRDLTQSIWELAAD